MSSGVCITNDDTTFSVQSVTPDSRTVTATNTVLKQGKYRYSVTLPSRGTNFSRSLTIGGTAIDLSNNILDAEIDLNANDQFVLSATANSYFAGIGLIMWKID